MDDKNVRDETSLKFCINNMTTGTVLGYVVTDIKNIQAAKDSKLIANLKDDLG